MKLYYVKDVRVSIAIQVVVYATSNELGRKYNSVYYLQACNRSV